jgi:AAA ATPase domain
VRHCKYTSLQPRFSEINQKTKMSSTIQGTIISSLSGSNTYYFDNEDLDQDLSLINAPILFGRDVEASMLKNCFQQLSLQEHNQLVRVLVHGESGSGKTSLIDCLRQPVLDSQGFFVCGITFRIQEIKNRTQRS